MIPHELLYGLLGLSIPLFAARLGVPLPGAKTANLRETVRRALLEVLKDIDPPKPAGDDELRQQLRRLLATDDKQ